GVAREIKPPIITRPPLQRHDSGNGDSEGSELGLVIQHLSESKSDLLGFVRTPERLDLRDIYPATDAPAKVELGASTCGDVGVDASAGERGGESTYGEFVLGCPLVERCQISR